MRSIQLMTLVVCLAVAAGPSWSQQPPASCPTLLIAEFPTDDGGSLCVWELSDCTANPVIPTCVIYADCAGDACTCVAGPACQTDGEEPAVEASDEYAFEDEVAPEDEMPGDEGMPGDAGMPDDEAMPADEEAAADARGFPKQHILTAMNSLLQPPRRIKKLRSNRRDFQFRIPRARLLVPAQANQIIETFGKGGRKVKYLKVLRLRTLDNQTEYYALYKVFNPAVNDPSGNQDLPSDSYLGVRMGQPAGRPPGGYATVNARAQAGRIRKLAPFAGNYVREAAVQVTIPPRGNKAAGAGPKKWFHLFGTVM
ncbi:MAG: hypothetical protein RIK87_03025 [Fuerstiella sp.]